MQLKEVWEKKHKDSEGRYNRVTDFARFCYYNFMKTKKKGKVLELCCGKGADSIFFHNKNMNVTAIDYSSEAINQFNEIQKKYDIFFTALVKDITKPLNFEPESFDFVYSRAGLYYFTDKELKNIILEVSNVLKSEGLFMFQVKSTSDKSFGEGKEIEKDMFEDDDGSLRHFFSREYAEELLDGFNIIMIEERKIHTGNAYLEVIAEKK